MKDSYLIMSQQTVQKLMKKKNRKHLMPEHEAVMYRELCEMIAKEAECRRLYFEFQKILLQRDLDDEAATRDGKKST